MDIKNLMVGDWVYSYDCNDDVRIVGTEEQGSFGFRIPIVYIDDKVNGKGLNYLFLEEIEPIPLTDEILTASGFFQMEKSEHTSVFVLEADNGRDRLYFSVIGKTEKPDCIKIMYMPTNPVFWLDLILPNCYVHELQHILRLCGIEKEIKLK